MVMFTQVTRKHLNNEREVIIMNNKGNFNHRLFTNRNTLDLMNILDYEMSALLEEYKPITVLDFQTKLAKDFNLSIIMVKYIMAYITDDSIMERIKTAIA